MYRNDHVGRTMGNRPAFALPGRGRSPPALGSLRPYWAEKIPIPLDIPTLLRMSQLDLARILTENIVKNGYFQDIATGRNAAFTTGRSSWGLLYLIFA